jgi:hypothetical protein
VGLQTLQANALDEMHRLSRTASAKSVLGSFSRVAAPRPISTISAQSQASACSLAPPAAIVADGGAQPAAPVQGRVVAGHGPSSLLNTGCDSPDADACHHSGGVDPAVAQDCACAPVAHGGETHQLGGPGTGAGPAAPRCGGVHQIVRVQALR